MNDNYMITGTESSMTPGLQVFTKTEVKKGRPRAIRVAAYCRVSTNLEMQKSSLEIQMSAYERIIRQHPGWKLAGIYTDKGLSGTAASRRVQFQKMIEDARAGKIDYIIAKSTSRFARNTVDTLKYTRMLREWGVGVYFEEQKIDTGSITSEMLLTIHAAFAQEESHSISENLKRGVRSRFAMGIPKWSTTYGYRRISKDVWEPYEPEAAVVRRVFNMYLDGHKLPEIVQALENDGIPGPGKKNIWFAHSLSTILHNEKYIGDVAMQKDYTIDHMTHKRKRNRDASVTRYYRKDHHTPIIDRKTFADVQVMLEMNDPHKGAIQYPFYGTLRCPFCGEKMVAVSLPSRWHHQAWTCGGPSSEKVLRSERTSCPQFFVKNFYVVEGVVDAFRNLCRNLQEKPGSDFVAKLEKHKDRVMRGEVHYMFLLDLVESISFREGEDGKVMWDTLVVRWKCQAETTGHIEYRRASEIPVTKDSAELRGMVYYANGEPTNGQTNAYYSVQGLFEFCDKLMIHESFADEKVGSMSSVGILIPAVLAPTTTKVGFEGEVKYEGAKAARNKGDKDPESGCLCKGEYA